MNRRAFLGTAAGGAAVLGAGGYGLSRLLESPPPPLVRSFRSRPDLRPPAVAVDRRGEPGSTLLFVAPMGGPGQRGPLILDEDGEPVWFRPGRGLAVLNFRVQRYRGEPVLTFWEGHVAHGFGEGDGVVLDRSYREVARIRGANDIRPDLHELLLTGDGTALVTAYRRAADAHGKVVEGVVQELDVATGSSRFEWHSLDHVPVAESNRRRMRAPFDYFHANSVDVDRDGNLLVSARHTSTVYKLDRGSGEVLWRLGGTRSDFRIGQGARFAFQHDVRRRDDGTISLFDNAAAKPLGPESRALVLDLDEDAMQARLARAYADDQHAQAMGSMETLTDGSVFVGWGTRPVATHFEPDGTLRLRASLPKGAISYRAFRFDWDAVPAAPPAVASRRRGDGHELAISWNGATGVARWRIDAGAERARLARVGEVERTGFETLARIDGGHSFAAVAALDASGRVLGRSPAVALAAAA